MSATEWKFRIFFIILLLSEIWLLSTCIPIRTKHYTAKTRFPDWFRRFTSPTPSVRPKLTFKPLWKTSTLPYVDYHYRKPLDSTTATVWVIYGIVFLACLLLFLLKNIYCMMMHRIESESSSRTTDGPPATNRNSLSTITVPHTTDNSGGVDNEAFFGDFPSYGVSSTADKPPGYSDVMKSDLNTGETKFPEVFPQIEDETPPPKYDETFVQRY